MLGDLDRLLEPGLGDLNCIPTMIIRITLSAQSRSSRGVSRIASASVVGPCNMLAKASIPVEQKVSGSASISTFLKNLKRPQSATRSPIKSRRALLTTSAYLIRDKSLLPIRWFQPTR